jgi:uncharacterized protein (TIGR03435 family)
VARLICLLLVVSAAAAQPATDQVRFEVASVKPSGPKSVRGSNGGPGTHDPQLYTFGRVTLVDLIWAAYDVRPFQVSSKIALDNDEFDLAASLPAETTKPQFRSMLQNLLADRFHFKLHVISKEFPAYALVVTNRGPKFQAGSRDPQPSQLPDDGFPEVATNRPDIRVSFSASRGFELVRLSAHQEPIPIFAAMLRVPDSQPVIDQTGLTGSYDFRLAYSLELKATTSDSPPPLPDLFSAIQQQLGLRLVHKRLPFDVLIIDQVDRFPTEN